MASLIGAFAYSRQLTVNTSATGANIGALTDFPICVAVNSSSWTNATERGHFFNDTYNPLGKRVQFFDADGTTNLAYEVESYDAATQVAVYWVKKPAVASASTTDHIHVGYGNDPNAANQDAATSVWDANFKAVWHFGAKAGADSTSNGNNLTVSGAAAQTDGSHYFDAVDDKAKIDSPASLNITGALTIEAYLKRAAWASYAGVVSKVLYDDSWTNPYQQYAMARQGSDDKIRWVRTLSTTGQHEVTNTTALGAGWRHVAGVFDGTYMRFYLDGAADGTSASNTTSTVSAATDVCVGVSHDVPAWAEGFQGYMQEVRISATGRTADWAKAATFSMKATSFSGDGWLTWGTEAVRPVAQYAAAGTAACTSADSGTVCARLIATATAACVSVATCVVMLAAVVSGSCAATSGASCDATRVPIQYAAAGTISAVSGLSGAAIRGTPATGTVAGTSDTSGAVTLRAVAGGSAAATSAISGAATGLMPAVGSANAVFAASCASGQRACVNGTVAITSGSSCDAMVSSGASGTVAVASGASCNITLRACANGTVVCVSTIAGIIGKLGWDKRPVGTATWTPRDTADASWTKNTPDPATWDEREVTPAAWTERPVDPSTWTKR